MATYAEIKNITVPLLGVQSAGSNLARALQAAAILAIEGAPYMIPSPTPNVGQWRNRSQDVGKRMVDGTTINAKVLCAGAAIVTGTT